MQFAQVAERPIAGLRPYPGNARTHSKKQLRQIAASISRFGFTNPVLVSDEGEIIAGHGRVEAAKSLGWKAVPTIALSHISDAERRAYVLADNKLALNAGWDRDILAIELQALVDLEFDVELTGFSLAEIDLVLDEAGDADPDGVDAPEDAVPVLLGEAVTRRGDVWLLGRHRLLCGDAQEADDFAALMGNERVDLVFTDPPYNVKIDGNVCGLGSVKHREFAFASGEMSGDQFTRFLASTLGNASAVIHHRFGELPYRELLPKFGAPCVDPRRLNIVQPCDVGHTCTWRKGFGQNPHPLQPGLQLQQADLPRAPGEHGLILPATRANRVKSPRMTSETNQRRAQQRRTASVSPVVGLTSLDVPGFCGSPAVGRHPRRSAPLHAQRMRKLLHRSRIRPRLIGFCSRRIKANG